MGFRWSVSYTRTVDLSRRPHLSVLLIHGGNLSGVCLFRYYFQPKLQSTAIDHYHAAVLVQVLHVKVFIGLNRAELASRWIQKVVIQMPVGE
jgi:hypothetical protein